MNLACKVVTKSFKSNVFRLLQTQERCVNLSSVKHVLGWIASYGLLVVAGLLLQEPCLILQNKFRAINSEACQRESYFKAYGDVAYFLTFVFERTSAAAQS